MGENEDRLFERWCRHGDAEALGELFDLASPGLLRLAIHLVGEPAEAEDLVQATFLAAIEQRASVDSSRPVLPWLTAVLSNKAADHKRRASRSLDVERMLQSAEGDASHPVEQRELSGELAKAIDALEEPYRQVMILRLRHGLSPADIAHVLERSPGAVRVQLHRAQQQLRGRLPPSLVGAFLVAAAAPRGLAAVRGEIIAKALSVAPAVSATATTATLLGGLVMGKKIAVAVVAGILAAGVWWLASREAAPHASSPAPDSATSMALAGSEATASPSVPDAEHERTAIRSNLEPTETSRFGSLDIDVVWADGTPASGVGLEQLGSVSTNGRSTYWTTDASGRVHIDQILAGARGFLLDRWSRFDPAFRQIDAEVQAVTLNRLRIEVPKGRDVRGRVLDADGKAVAGAELWGSSVATPHLFGQTAHDGTFLVRSLPEGVEGAFYYLFAKSEHRGISKSVQLSELEQDSQGDLVVELHLSPTTAELAGKVVGSNGEPIGEAEVIITLHADTSVDRKTLVAHSSSDGSFRIPGLCRSSIAVEVGAPEYPLWRTQLDLDHGEVQWLEVQLQQGVTVVGSIRSADGVPVRGRVEWADNQRLSYSPGDLVWKKVRDSDPAPDAFRLVGLPPGPIALEAQSTEGFPIAKASTTLHGKPGETLRWDAVLEADNGTIVGRVVDEAGRPQVRWYIAASAQGVGGGLVPTDSEGRFVLRNCPDADHLIRLYWPDKGTTTLVSERDFVRPGDDEVLFVVSPGMIPSASLSGMILDVMGSPVRELLVYAEDDRGESRGRRTYMHDGRFQIELLSAGRYRLGCHSRQLAQEVLGTFELKPNEVLDVGTLQLSPRGFLELTMRRRDGVALSGPDTRVVGGEGRFVSLRNETTDDGTLYRSPALIPGRYSIYPTFTNAAGPTCEVWIRGGEMTSLDIDLEPGAWRVIDFRVPAGARPPTVLNLAIRDGSEASVLQDECRYFTRDKDGHWIHRFVTSLPVGDYQFEATSEEGLAALGSFAVIAPDLQDGFVVELTQRP